MHRYLEGNLQLPDVRGLIRSRRMMMVRGTNSPDWDFEVYYKYSPLPLFKRRQLVWSRTRQPDDGNEVVWRFELLSGTYVLLYEPYGLSSYLYVQRVYRDEFPAIPPLSDR